MKLVVVLFFRDTLYKGTHCTMQYDNVSVIKPKAL